MVSLGNQLILCLTRGLPNHTTQAEAGAGSTYCPIRPVDLHHLARVLQGRKGYYHAECACIHNIPRITNIDIATGEVIQYPALPFAVGLAGALVAAERGELHTGDEARSRTGQAAHIINLKLVEGRVHDIDTLLIG